MASSDFTLISLGAAALLISSLQGQVASRSAKPSTDGLSCSRFEWNDSTKSVMRVPIWMNGTQYWYQLDTGADVVIVYGAKQHEGWTPKGDSIRVPHVRFAGMSL